MFREHCEELIRHFRHDIAYCHCRRHYLPDLDTKRNRLIRLSVMWSGAAAAMGWLSYQFVRWASDIPGMARLG